MTDDAIRELFGQVPYWADQTIRLYDPVALYEDFITEAYWSSRASVNVAELRGMWLESAQAPSWREFLDGEKTAANLRLFRENPGYYTGLPERNPSMSFIRVNGRLYVEYDGRCRAVIAKFHLDSQSSPYLHNVELREYTVDFEFMGLYGELVKTSPARFKVNVAHALDHREDGPGWKRDYYRKLSAQVTDTRTGKSTVYDKFGLMETVAALKRKEHCLFGRIFWRIEGGIS